MATATLIATDPNNYYCSNCGETVLSYEDNITDHENVHERIPVPDGGCLATWNGWATKDPSITTVPHPELWSALSQIQLADVVFGPGVS